MVGLSPAWQRTLTFESFRPGQVNRARGVTETASGKGVNVARVAMQLGANVRLLTVAGGARGDLLAESLKAQRVNARVIRVKAETRSCQTLLSGGSATELVEEAGRLSKHEVAKVWICVATELRRARLVVLTGTVPPGCGSDFYGRVVREARRVGVPALVDAQGVQLKNAARAKPAVIRVNRDEFEAVPGILAEWIVVSDGAKRMTVMHGHDSIHLAPPRIRAVNPVGSGDAMLAGIACMVGRGKTILEAVRFGMACGAANAMSLTAGVIKSRDAAALLRRVRRQGRMC